MAWTDKYVSVAGSGAADGSSPSNEWTMAQGISNEAGGLRFNVRAGTYSAAARTWSVAGTASSGMWWRGYNATPGDIDSNNALTKPAILAGSDAQTFSGAHRLFSNFDFSGARAGVLLSVTGAHVHFDRCRGENTDSGSTSYTLRASGNGFYASRSWFKAHVSCNFVAILEERGAVDHCVFRGGKSGLMLDATTAFSAALFCVFDDQADSYAIDVVNVATSTSFIILGNTIYGAGSHGIRLSATQPAFALIRGNILANNGGYGMSTASGTVRVARGVNDFYLNTSGTENGFGDWPSVAEQIESGSPFTNAGSHDFSLASGVNAKANGAGGAFENESYESFLDIGAVQEENAGGGGSSAIFSPFSSPVIRGVA